MGSIGYGGRTKIGPGASAEFNPHMEAGVNVRTRYHVEHYAHFHLDGARCAVPHDLCPMGHPRKRLLWVEDFDNIVVNVGLTRIITAAVKGQAVGGAAAGYQDGRRLPAVWAASTAYSAGDVVRATTPGTNNRFFICEVAGTSAATEPTFPTTDSGSVVDNTVTWREASRWFIGLKGTGAVAAGDTMASHAGWAELTPYSNATRVGYVPGTVTNGSVDNSASVAVFNINATATVFGALLADLATKAGTLGTLYGAGDFAASRGVASGDTMNITVTTSVS